MRRDERLEMAAADFFLALDQELHVERQAPPFREERLGDFDGDEQRPFVVGRAARVQPALAQRGTKRRTVPLVDRVFWLDVVMSVDQRGRRAGGGQPLGVHDARAGRGHDPDGERSRRREPRGDPRRRGVQVGGVHGLGADAGDRGELDQLGEDSVVRALEARKHGGEVRHFPPSTPKTCPVIHPAWSEAKNSTPAATSSGVPSRRSAMPA